MRTSLTTFQLEYSTAFESLKHVIAIIICVPITSVIVWWVFDKYDFDWIDTGLLRMPSRMPTITAHILSMVYGHLLENGSHQRRRRHQKHQHSTKLKKRVHDYLPRHYSMHRHGCHNLKGISMRANVGQSWIVNSNSIGWTIFLSVYVCFCFFFQNLCGARLHLTRSPFLSSIIYFWFFFNFNEHLQSDTCLFFLLCCHIKFNHIFFQLYVNKSD